jgi:hypothetical protein
MNTQTSNSFMPLFRAWLETANLAKQVGSQGLSTSGENLLVELDLAPMEAAETTLLDHAPKTAVEAVCMIEIIRQNLSDAGRSDGRDMRALDAIQSWLAGAALDASDHRDEVEQLLTSVSNRT